MAPQFSDAIGGVAAALTTLAFLPQVILTWRARHARGVSLGMVSMCTAGTAMWLWYGLLITSVPVICANVVSLVLLLALLAMKLRWSAQG
jgi:MtN3 and saliva related transmembrane protein